jgi:hypothetical protein
MIRDFQPDIIKLEDEYSNIFYTFQVKDCIDRNEISRLLDITSQLFQKIEELEKEKVKLIDYNNEKRKEMFQKIKKSIQETIDIIEEE